MSKFALSNEKRVDMVWLLCVNGSNCTAAGSAHSKKYGKSGRKIHPKTIQRQVTKFETVEGPKTREKVTVWMGLSNHGVFGSHSFENEDAKGNTIRTENNIAMLRGEVLQVLKIKQKHNSYIFNKRDPSSLLS